MVAVVGELSSEVARGGKEIGLVEEMFVVPGGCVGSAVGSMGISMIETHFT